MVKSRNLILQRLEWNDVCDWGLKNPGEEEGIEALRDKESLWVDIFTYTCRCARHVITLKVNLSFIQSSCPSWLARSSKSHYWDPLFPGPRSKSITGSRCGPWRCLVPCRSHPDRWLDWLILHHIQHTRNLLCWSLLQSPLWGPPTTTWQGVDHYSPWDPIPTEPLTIWGIVSLYCFKTFKVT